MVTIENKQTQVTFAINQLHDDALHVLGMLNYHDYDLGIWLIDNDAMQQYNKQYRHKDEPTDILSFPFHQLKPGERINPTSDDDKNVGDLLISLEFVQERYPDNFYPRIQRLLVHGICHLLGYDHESEENDKVMKELEDSLLAKISSLPPSAHD